VLSPRALGRRSRRGAAVVVVQREQSASRQKQGHQDRATLARLNRQVQARHSPKGIQRVVKATCSLEISAGLVPTPMLAMPSKAHCPQPWGQRVGGVSGRPTRETKRSDPLPSPRFATVEGTLVHRMPIAFAGGRWSVDLGRSDAVVWGSSQAVGRTGDNRCPLEE
jgi:hypothetical protein